MTKKWAADFRSTEYGVFLATGVTIRLNTQKHILMEIFRKFGSFPQMAENTDIPQLSVLTLKDLKWSDLSAIEQQVFLTSIHEENHFRLFITTPVGLLIWRCYEVIVRGVAYLIGELERIGVEKIHNQPLIKWYRAEGKQFVKKRISEAHAAKRFLLPFDRKDFRDAYLWKLDDVINEIAAVHRFIAIIMGHTDSHIRIGEFCALANEVYGYLAERCVLPCRPEWKSRYPLDQDLYPNWNWVHTIGESFEGAARLWERWVLRELDASSESINVWEKKNIKGIYAPAYRFLTTEIRDERLSYILLNLALTSPIDPSCFYPSQREVYLEDVFPCYRLARLVQACKNETGAVLEEEKLLSAAGLESTLNTLTAALQTGFLGEGANWDGTEIEESRSETLPKSLETLLYPKDYFANLLTKFQAGFIERLHGLGYLDISQQAVEEARSMKPDIEFFEDYVSLNNVPKKSRLVIYLHHIIHITTGLAAIALLENKPMRNPRQLIEPFLNRISMETQDEDVLSKIKGYLEPEDIIHRSLGKTATRSIRMIK